MLRGFGTLEFPEKLASCRLTSPDPVIQSQGLFIDWANTANRSTRRRASNFQEMAVGIPNVYAQAPEILRALLFDSDSVLLKPCFQSRQRCATRHLHRAVKGCGANYLS
jgi:hypothetical protein